MRNSVLRWTNGKTETKVHLLSCASQLKISNVEPCGLGYWDVADVTWPPSQVFTVLKGSVSVAMETSFVVGTSRSRRRVWISAQLASGEWRCVPWALPSHGRCCGCLWSYPRSSGTRSWVTDSLVTPQQLASRTREVRRGQLPLIWKIVSTNVNWSLK